MDKNETIKHLEQIGFRKRDGQGFVFQDQNSDLNIAIVSADSATIRPPKDAIKILDAHKIQYSLYQKFWPKISLADLELILPELIAAGIKSGSGHSKSHSAKKEYEGGNPKIEAICHGCRVSPQLDSNECSDMVDGRRDLGHFWCKNLDWLSDYYCPNAVKARIDGRAASYPKEYEIHCKTSGAKCPFSVSLSTTRFRSRLDTKYITDCDLYKAEKNKGNSGRIETYRGKQ